IIVGSGTVLADDPSLDCRLLGLADSSPKKIVFDRRLRVSPDAKIFSAKDAVVITASDVDFDAYTKAGIAVHVAKDDSWLAMLEEVAKLGVTSILLEGGAQMHAAALDAGVVDEVITIQAPKFIGGDGISCVGARAVGMLAQLEQFQHIKTRILGDNTVHHHQRDLGTYQQIAELFSHV
ncbi:MAG: RibD family protein, partial [Pseudomonadota bacterium]